MLGVQKLHHWQRKYYETSMRKLRKGDKVYVIAGQSKGQTGEILSVIPSKQKVIIKGIAIKKKCVKATQDNQKGGIFDIEAPISWSNVMLVDPDTKKPTRVRIYQDDAGKKHRVSVSSGAYIDG